MTVRAARIRMENLEPLENLTEQEMAELFGAGRKGKWQFSGQSMEVLEVRQAMSAVTVAIDGSTAKITGSSASDTVFVQRESGGAFIETGSPFTQPMGRHENWIQGIALERTHSSEQWICLPLSRSHRRVA